MNNNMDNNINNEHELKEDIVVDVYYPNHEPRTTSETFIRSRNHMIVELKKTCWVCNIDNETALKQNNGLELHHYFVEWAFSDMVDWTKMKTLHPDFNWDKYTKPEDFVDSEYNMMVLCQTHHRHKDYGIHMLPFPIWIAQTYKSQEFVLQDLKLKLLNT